MRSVHHTKPEDESFSVAWRLRDLAAVERELEFAFGRAPDNGRWVKAFLGAFSRELQSHPIEWPQASRSPSEHAWRFENIQVRYRLIPSDQTVDILSLSGPHTD